MGTWEHGRQSKSERSRFLKCRKAQVWMSLPVLWLSEAGIAGFLPCEEGVGAKCPPGSHDRESVTLRTTGK